MSAPKRRKTNVERISTEADEAAHAGGRPPLLRLTIAVVRGPVCSFLSYQSTVRLSTACRELLSCYQLRREQLIKTLLPRLDRVCSGQCLVGGPISSKCIASVYVPKFSPFNRALDNMDKAGTCRTHGAPVKAHFSAKRYCLTVSPKVSPAKVLQGALERIRRAYADKRYQVHPTYRLAVQEWMGLKGLDDGIVFDD